MSMASIPNVGSSFTASPTEVNRQAPAARARNTANADAIDPTAQPRFVDRRRNRDRRLHPKKPLLDTRRNTDRRRTGRFEAKI